MVDAELESLIDRAGRDEVFARASELGWVGGTPPKWVWREIANEVLAKNDAIIFGYGYIGPDGNRIDPMDVRMVDTKPTTPK